MPAMSWGDMLDRADGSVSWSTDSHGNVQIRVGGYEAFCFWAGDPSDGEWCWEVNGDGPLADASRAVASATAAARAMGVG
jgi:hypothetical protein